jgi:hypothetical protein
MNPITILLILTIPYSLWLLYRFRQASDKRSPEPFIPYLLIPVIMALNWLSPCQSNPCMVAQEKIFRFSLLITTVYLVLHCGMILTGKAATKARPLHIKENRTIH